MCADEKWGWQEKQRVGQEYLQFASGYALGSVLKQPAATFWIHTNVFYTIPNAATFNLKAEMQLNDFAFVTNHLYESLTSYFRKQDKAFLPLK